MGFAPELGAVAKPGQEVKILENSAGGARLELGLTGGVSIQCRLTAGESNLELRLVKGSGYLGWETSSRYLVVPDYFADDAVYDGSEAGKRCLPTENFCLQCLEGGNALIMAVWPSSDQEAWILGAVRGAAAGVGATQVRVAPGQGIWLAFLEGAQLWQTSPAPVQAAVPFPAASCGWRRRPTPGTSSAGRHRTNSRRPMPGRHWFTPSTAPRRRR